MLATYHFSSCINFVFVKFHIVPLFLLFISYLNYQVGAADYIAVARNYHTIFISGVPVMSMRIRDKVLSLYIFFQYLEPIAIYSTISL